MTTINVNAGNVKASIDFDQNNEQSTEGMTSLEKLASLKGPLDFIRDEVTVFSQEIEVLDFVQEQFSPGGAEVNCAKPEIVFPIGPPEAEPSETISFMGGEQTPISADTEINGSSITVDGQTFEMNLHLTREYDTSLPLINGFEIPPEVGYTVNEDGVAEFYVKDDVVQNPPVFAPVENIDDDADIGSITYSKDQSQNV
jgi:hypothetical protein